MVTEDRLEPVRRYYRLRPARVRLAADPDRITYRSFAVPLPAFSPEYHAERARVRIDPSGELPAHMPIPEAQKMLNDLDKIGDSREAQEVLREFPPRAFNIHVAHFLLDRESIIRWVRIECPPEELSGWGSFPTDEELVAAARAVLR